MKKDNNNYHTITLSDDGTYTAYSQEYDEHYHSTKDGALRESIVKHIKPALMLKMSQKTIVILDICFGLGFNTFGTLYYAKKYNLASKIEIYSPELDSKLVASLKDFTYPKEFDSIKNIIDELILKSKYEDDNIKIELFLGDARSYIKTFKENMFDIVYQDAFSPGTNPILWTKEYFRDISKIIKKDGVLTTYSTAFKTRLALYENDFNIYLNSGEDFRDATLATCDKLDNYKLVDMKHKIACNAGVDALCDGDFT